MSRTGSFPVWAALVGSGLAGVLVALQSRINGGLSQELGNGYVTAAVSFSIGLVIMSLVMLLSRAGRVGFTRLKTELRAGRLPYWTLFGGAGGAFFVLSQGLVAPLTGLALFTVGIVAGQVLGGLVLDRVGLGPGGRIDPTPPRIVGTALAVIAVALSVGMGAGDPKVLWLVVFPVLVGVCVSGQSMVNGLVRAASHSAITSTFINFVVGTTILVLIACVSVAVSGWPQTWPSAPFYYIGGFVGTIFIAVAAMLVRTAGVLLLSMSNVAGQLIAAVAFEAGVPLAGGLTQGMIAGTAVALLAVAIAALPWRGRASGGTTGR
ncbi:DMT family transporter [Leucobacter luti]|uniref:Transporter family-2 protein n=1 Tax=Leucobacter luti TaxID=340320 RepID=A0A4R6S789_9MICO|nr:DMT family transporter [Leucobacter luti]QYM75303.1 DMT family transporter [Leucobacter luti]TDP95581.1 transporter family-2 protein [Leucobacter luti]